MHGLWGWRTDSSRKTKLASFESSKLGFQIGSETYFCTLSESHGVRDTDKAKTYDERVPSIALDFQQLCKAHKLWSEELDQRSAS